MNTLVYFFNKFRILFFKIQNNHYYKFNSIDKSVKFCPEYPGKVILINPTNIFIGEKTVINRNTHINPGKSKVVIGKYCHLGKGLTIYAFNHSYENATKIPYDEKIDCKPVIIEDCVWFGANVTVVPGVKIGKGSVIGAGSVVVKDVPDCAVVGGNPAKILKHRDKDVFVKKYDEKLFF